MSAQHLPAIVFAYAWFAVAMFIVTDTDVNRDPNAWIKRVSVALFWPIVLPAFFAIAFVTTIARVGRAYAAWLGPKLPRRRAARLPKAQVFCGEALDATWRSVAKLALRLSRRVNRLR